MCAALKEIGAVLVVLAVVFIVGNCWFHIVEAVLRRIKRIFMRDSDGQVWHTLPKDWEDGDKKGEP